MIYSQTQLTQLHNNSFDQSLQFDELNISDSKAAINQSNDFILKVEQQASERLLDTYNAVFGACVVLFGLKYAFKTIPRFDASPYQRARQRLADFIMTEYSSGQPDIKRIVKYYNIICNQLAAVFETELSRVINEATRQAAKQRGFKFYTLDNILDKRTSSFCQAIDRTKRYSIDDVESMPPFHYRCRTTIKPIF